MMVYKTLQKTVEENKDRQKHFIRAALHPQWKMCKWGEAKQGINAEGQAETVKRGAK